MAFVTKYKLQRVLSNLTGDFEKDPVRRYMKTKYIYLPDGKVDYLTIYYRFMENPRKFIETTHLKWLDNRQNAIEKPPAYHFTSECSALNSKFDNVILPPIIQQNSALLEEAREIARRMGLYKFGEKSEIELKEYVTQILSNEKFTLLNLTSKDFKIVLHKKNSGIEYYNNLTLNQIKTNLEGLLKKFRFYLGLNEVDKLILPNDFLSRPYKYDEIRNFYNRAQVLSKYKNQLYSIIHTEKGNRSTDYCNNSEVTQIAKELIHEFVDPTSTLVEVNIYKNATSTDFDQTVLEILGFKSCNGSMCKSNLEIEANEKLFIKRKVLQLQQTDLI